jgi:hypothetical protein
MGSENPSGADNQQERPSSSNWLDRIPCDLGNWVAGFVDGEGSFNVPIRREITLVEPRRETSESSEAICRAPSLKRGMKIWSTPHGDMRIKVNYNG